MIITSSLLITCNSHATAIADGAIFIDKGIIRAIGPLCNITQQFPYAKVIQLQNALLMPGLINTHTHLELPELLNTIRSKNFTDWILNLIAAKKKLVNKDYTIAMHNNISTLVQTGTTMVGEISTHGISYDLLKRSGLRAIVYHENINMASDRNGHGPKNSLFTRGDSVLVQSGLSPHSPYTVSQAVLLNIRKAAHTKNFRLTMHIAESKEENRLLQRKSSGLEKLYQFVAGTLTGPRWVLRPSNICTESDSYPLTFSPCMRFRLWTRTSAS